MSWKEVLLWEPESTSWESRAEVLYYQTGEPEYQTYAISSWNQGLKVFRWEPPQWVFKEKTPELILFNKHGARSFEFDCFAKEIPEEVTARVSGFLSLQLQMLRMVRQGKAAMELFHSSPVLFWILADAFPKRGRRFEDLERLLEWRRIDLIREFVGDFSKKQLIAIDRLLRNVILLRGDLIDLKTLRESIHRPEVVRKANSIGRIHITLLSCLNEFPEYLHWKWIRYCAPESYAASSFLRSTLRLWEDTVRLGKALAVRKPEKEIQTCTSIEQLQRKHDDWVREYNMKFSPDLDECNPFPPPPVPGNADIQPIRIPRDLLQESREMEHCAIIYEDGIYKGSCYLYKVLWPERGTLELAPGLHGWYIRQFVRTGNKEPSRKSWEHVQSWLVNANRGQVLGAGIDNLRDSGNIR